jgi:hypothetical protein
MPNQRKRDPLGMMVADLRAGRAAGLSFDAAWETGWRRITHLRQWPHATIFRAQAKHALLAAKEEFRAAYELRETALSLALKAIDDFGDRGDTARVLVLSGGEDGPFDRVVA